MAIDVSRRAAEQALRDSEARFRQLADAMPQLVWTAAADGRVDYYNERVSEYSGFHQNADGSWGWEPVLHPDDLARTVEAWTRALAGGEPYEIAHRVQRQDGGYRWVLSRGLPVRNAAGRVVKWFGTATDIDRQKRAEEALLDADRRKDEFLAMLSHELRNPLAPIRNSVYLLQQLAPPPGAASEPARRAQQVIERQVQHMTRLIDDLLDVTRISRGKIDLRREPVDLGELVRRTAEDHRTVFDREEIALEVDVDAAPRFVSGDATRLSQVIGNLLANAAKYTPRGGHVVVSLRREGDSARIGVCDDGQGIAPEMLARLFDPFTQGEQGLERNAGGLGLGLALVRGLVELHGGSAEAHSEGPGRGAEFVVRLPLVAGDVPSAAAVPSGAPERGGRRVLVIEDNRDAAESLRDVLEIGGHVVDVAATGPAGLERIRTFRPDVVLCDIGLPDLDGYGIARAVRADPGLRSVILVALSGYTLQDDVERAREAGFDHHVGKPADLDTLARLIAEL